MKKKGVSRTKATLFSVAVAFVSVFFFAYAVQAFYPAPQYDDFCEMDISPKFIDNEAECVQVGGMWTDYERDSLNMEVSGYCDMYYYCERDYQEVRVPYERNVFFINLGVGVVLFIGAFFLALESVSTGLMGGAIMMIVYACIRYWGELSDIWRTLILGVALVALIWLGYKKLND